ncbi:tripartite motif-containing protein 2-like [Mytilus californianus]|uniref:tripartite motif-containing protein 2-like n=1 Tax=Mytilus californianus TaxID=6549 RepID=UPI002246CA1D|nr:tripartite motif-containing protein 2-like [Mytilus californianus]
MEKGGRKKGDLLTCSICLETYKTPKYLPCLHTFCKLCIHTYIQSVKVGKEEDDLLTCSICLQTYIVIKEEQADKTTAVSCSITCEDHSDKFIMIYCVDHNKPCCTVCATVKHRKKWYKTGNSATN